MHSVPHTYDEINHGLLQRAHGGQQLRFAVHDLFFHFLFHTTECGTRLFLEVVFIFLLQVLCCLAALQLYIQGCSGSGSDRVVREFCILGAHIVDSNLFIELI